MLCWRYALSQCFWFILFSILPYFLSVSALSFVSALTGCLTLLCSSFSLCVHRSLNCVEEKLLSLHQPSPLLQIRAARSSTVCRRLLRQAPRRSVRDVSTWRSEETPAPSRRPCSWSSPSLWPRCLATFSSSKCHTPFARLPPSISLFFYRIRPWNNFLARNAIVFWSSSDSIWYCICCSTFFILLSVVLLLFSDMFTKQKIE